MADEQVLKIQNGNCDEPYYYSFGNYLNIKRNVFNIKCL